MVINIIFMTLLAVIVVPSLTFVTKILIEEFQKFEDDTEIL